MKLTMNRLGIMLSAVLLSACASQIPEQIRNAPKQSPTVGEGAPD